MTSNENKVDMEKAYKELQETIHSLRPRLPGLTLRELEEVADVADDSVGTADLTNHILVSYSILADGAVLALARITAGKTDRARLTAAVGIAERTSMDVIHCYCCPPIVVVRWVRAAALLAWALVDEELSHV